MKMVEVEHRTILRKKIQKNRWEENRPSVHRQELGIRRMIVEVGYRKIHRMMVEERSKWKIRRKRVEVGSRCLIHRKKIEGLDRWVEGSGRWIHMKIVGFVHRRNKKWVGVGNKNWIHRRMSWVLDKRE